MIAQRLRDLDNRVLGYDKRVALLRTEEGWRKTASRWRLLAVLAVLELAVVVVSVVFDTGSFVALVGLGGITAFQAGSLKAEDDRLHGRGMYRYLPPGL
jgi:hypothetical protein